MNRRVYFHDYQPRNFSDAHAVWGADLELFLCNQGNLALAETASDLGRPAVESLAVPLLHRFGETAKEFRFRQLVGHMLRHMMESRGWILDQTEVRIPGGPLFTRAARYRRGSATPRHETLPKQRPQGEIAAFFNYYRERYEVAAALPSYFGLPGDRLTPDQHVLIGAGLDSLAGHWADLCHGPASHQDRMAGFLALHGGHACFDRVATPYLLRYAQNLGKKLKSGNAEDRSALEAIVRNACPPLPPRGRFCSWTTDATADEVLAHPEATSGALRHEWVTKHRYGGMLYMGYRCFWIHEFAEGFVTDRSISDSDEPHYESHMNQRVLVFPGDFLLRTYAHSVRSFEAFCTEHELVPAKRA